MKTTKIAILFLILSLTLEAQDLHFSDFYAFPLHTNPALCGMFHGGSRFSGIIRDQYRAVTLPYQTIGLSFDHKKEKIMNTRNNLAFGLLMNGDVAGDSKFGTYQISVPIALQVISINSQLQVSYGASIGATFNTIDYTDLHYPEEFEGDRLLEHPFISENQSNTLNSYFTLALGINARYNIDETTGLSVGGAIFNLNNPASTLQGDKQVKIHRRYMIHSILHHRFGDWIDLMPSLKIQFQGPFQEIQIGGQIARYFDKLNIQQIHLGYWYRAKYSDAMILNLGCEIGAFELGVSYDINTSDLQEASNNRGGVEFSLTYIYTKKKSTKKRSIRCPGHF